MSHWIARLALAMPAMLAGAFPCVAQTVAPIGAGNFWPLVILNAVVALLGLFWLLLMARRRG